jgi:hypothetical protein
MIKRRHFIIVLCLILASCGFASIPVTPEIVEVEKIWDQAPHNAFTDLVRWQDTFYCAFREGRGHVSTDGRIRILESKDANIWASAAVISRQGYDLRDAHLSVTPDGRLMLLGGAAPREKDNQSAPTGTFVSFSSDGRQWTEPQIVVEPGRWLWCVTWHQAEAYGVSYTAGRGDDRYLDLLVSDDGIHYKPHVSRLFDKGYPTQVTLRFDSDGTCYALVRRERRGDDPNSAMVGISVPDYKQWQWKDLGAEFNGFGGPNFIQIPGGYWLAAGRMHEGGAHTALCYLDVENGVMTKLTKLPSGGDTSYPGMVWHNNMLYVSYYSSHEGKTSIYLAKVRVTPKSTSETRNADLPKAFLNAGEILKAWQDNYAHFESMQVSYTHRVLEVRPPAENPHRYDNMVMVMHVERAEQGNRFNIRYSTAEDGFAQPDSILMGAFDGQITREYNAAEKSGMIIRGMIGRNTETMNHLKRYMRLSRKRLTKRKASGPYKIYWIEDPNSKPELSRTLGSAILGSVASVLPELEFVAGQMCHVVEIAYNKSRKIWFAHEKGMLPLKYQRYENNELVFEIEVEQIGSVDTDKGDVWYPQKAYLTTDSQDAGRVKYELTTHAFVPNVKVDDNTFRFDFPKGTYVFDRVRGITGVDLPKEPPSLVGKPLPPLKHLNLRLDADHVEDKTILICFWDMEQRPSRSCITELAKQASRLQEKGVTVVAVQATKMDQNTLNEWVKKNSVPFAVGMVEGDSEKTRFAWGVRSLPWLILTHRRHHVIATGFGLSELDQKIKEAQSGNR